MRIVFIMWILLHFCRFASTQSNEKIFYVNGDNDYVVLVDKSVDVKKQVYENGSYNETFISKSAAQFKFALTVSKDEANNLDNNTLSTPEYMDAYINDCRCKVFSFEQNQYNNVSTIQYKIQRVEDGRSLIGYSDFLIVGRYLYNVVFLAFEDSFSLYETEYYNIMNTLIINDQ